MTDTWHKKFDMTGRVALVTGAGRGIGLAIARTLAAAGCGVAIQDLELPVATVAAESINAEGGRAVALGGDILDLTLPARAVAETVRLLGGLHVLVNNASIQQPGSWLEVSADEMARVHRADVISPVLFLQQAVPIFRAQKFGRIVNIGSIQQQRANPEMMPYSVSKGVLEKLTAGLANELMPDNITMNLIAPGWCNTYRNAHELSTEAGRAKAGKTIPAGRVGEPADFGELALLLCSDAAAYMTGQSIFVDGGLRF